MKPSRVYIMIAAAAALSGGLVRLCIDYEKPRPLQWLFSEAAAHGNVAELERLHALGAQIDGTPSHKDGLIAGAPALQAAAEAGQLDSVRWLLDQGADPNHLFAHDNPLGGAEHRIHEATEAVYLLRARENASRQKRPDHP